uniref:Secreted protein n=1 Tax=Mesocestoides corti TaxID=53468 RepID=A0A5K3FJ86_MESCO
MSAHSETHFVAIFFSVCYGLLASLILRCSKRRYVPEHLVQDHRLPANRILKMLNT